MRSGASIRSAARGVADNRLRRLRERHDGGNEFVAIVSRDHFGCVQVQVGHQAVGGAEVDAYDAVGFVTEVNLEHGSVCECAVRIRLKSVATRLLTYFRRFSRARTLPGVPGWAASSYSSKLRRQLLVDVSLAFFRKLALSFRYGPGVRFFERHVELEDFFEQFRRNLFRLLLADIEAFFLQQIVRLA